MTGLDACTHMLEIGTATAADIEDVFIAAPVKMGNSPHRQGSMTFVHACKHLFAGYSRRLGRIALGRNFLRMTFLFLRSHIDNLPNHVAKIDLCYNFIRNSVHHIVDLVVTGNFISCLIYRIIQLFLCIFFQRITHTDTFFPFITSAPLWIYHIQPFGL